MALNQVECPICGAEIDVPADVVQGELITCQECGAELEFTSLNPVTVEEAPQQEEDWGE